jgi:hypothetical protein
MENGEKILAEYEDLRKHIDAFRGRWLCVVAIEGYLHVQEWALVGLANQFGAKITINQTEASLHLDATINGSTIVACINNGIISPVEVENGTGT